LGNLRAVIVAAEVAARLGRAGLVSPVLRADLWITIGHAAAMIRIMHPGVCFEPWTIAVDSIEPIDVNMDAVMVPVPIVPAPKRLDDDNAETEADG
jgi:hypothetical protein